MRNVTGLPSASQDSGPPQTRLLGLEGRGFLQGPGLRAAEARVRLRAAERRLRALCPVSSQAPSHVCCESVFSARVNIVLFIILILFQFLTLLSLGQYTVSPDMRFSCCIFRSSQCLWSCTEGEIHRSSSLFSYCKGSVTFLLVWLFLGTYAFEIFLVLGRL